MIICVHTDVETCVVTGELVCDIFGSSLQYTSVDDHYTWYRGGEASLTSWTHHTTHTAIPEVGAVVVNLLWRCLYNTIHVWTNNSVRYSRVKLLFVSHVSHIETTCMQVHVVVVLVTSIYIPNTCFSAVSLKLYLCISSP